MSFPIISAASMATPKSVLVPLLKIAIASWSVFWAAVVIYIAFYHYFVPASIDNSYPVYMSFG